MCAFDPKRTCANARHPISSAEYVRAPTDGSLRRGARARLVGPFLRIVAKPWNHVSNDTLNRCCAQMGTGLIQRDIYLMNAALLCAIAEAEKDSTIRADLENMAYAYLRLAQTGHNAQ